MAYRVQASSNGYTLYISQCIFRVNIHTIGLVQRESRQHRLFSDMPEAASIAPLGSHRHSCDGGWLQEGLSADRRLTSGLEA